MNRVLEQFKDKKILILGFGMEGMSVYKFLKKYLERADITVADKKQLSELSDEARKLIGKDKKVGLEFGNNYLSNIGNFDVIIKSQGIPRNLIDGKFDKKSTSLTSITKIFLQLAKGKVVGVTGTKGKSTTSTLIWHVLKEAGLKVKLVGNIGNPSLDSLDDSKDTIYVHELSSGQLEGLDISPDIAVFLNIYKEHLDHHGNMYDYVKSKANIALHQKKTDVFIYNSGFEDIVKIASMTKAIKVGYDPKTFVLPLTSDVIPILGEHNINNVIAAILVCREMGVRDADIVRAIKTFKGLSHRIEVVGKANGNIYVDDSISTIPEATIAAVNSFPDHNITLILGGLDRGQEFAHLVQVLKRKKVGAVIIVGEVSDRLTNEFEKINSNIQLINMFGKSMEEIVDRAAEITKTGVVLLSPAAASYDEYINFEDRGNQFKEAVNNINK